MIFADTSFWFALHDGRDDHTSTARELVRRWSSETLLTTNHVVGETWTLIRARTWHGAAVTFADRVERSRRIDVMHVAPEIEAEAWAWLRRHDERRYSFVDATSFAVMREHGITRALAFDDDFAAAGFDVLTA